MAINFFDLASERIWQYANGSASFLMLLGFTVAIHWYVHWNIRKKLYLGAATPKWLVFVENFKAEASSRSEQSEACKPQKSSTGGEFKHKGQIANPYCAFKNDRERRRALMSRDVRIVLVAAIAALATWLSKGGAWVTQFLG